MLQVNENELVQRFRQPGGAGWVGFVNDLLWAACWQMGIPESEVRTCLRTEIPDGGVDTRVVVGSPADRTGYLQVPSIWQYKAADEATLTEASITISRLPRDVSWRVMLTACVYALISQKIHGPKLKDGSRLKSKQF